MPGWVADNSGQIRLQWTSLGDFLEWVNATVVPSAQAYGYRVTIEPIPKEEVAVDRA